MGVITRIDLHEASVRRRRDAAERVAVVRVIRRAALEQVVDLAMLKRASFGVG